MFWFLFFWGFKNGFWQFLLFPLLLQFFFKLPPNLFLFFLQFLFMFPLQFLLKLQFLFFSLLCPFFFLSIVQTVQKTEIRKIESKTQITFPAPSSCLMRLVVPFHIPIAFVVSFALSPVFELQECQ